MHRKQWFEFQMRWILSLLMIVTVSPVTLPHLGLGESRLMAQSASWGNIFGFLGQRRGRKGGRGEFCVLLPSGKVPVILWHNRPLFIWRGLYQTIGLRKKKDGKVFWRQSLTQPGEIVNQLQYDGKEALQLGEEYELLFFSAPDAKTPAIREPFTVVAPPDRARIVVGLRGLTRQWQRRGANEEEIAQTRAQFFTDRQLDADVWQTIYSVPTLAAKLNQEIATTVTEACKQVEEK